MTSTETLPARLRETGLFCCWRREERGGKTTKVPYNPRTGGRAKSNDPATFAPLAAALKAAGGYDGLGVGVFGDLGAIDIDHCVGEGGEISDLAVEIITAMDAYTEYSPSGNGIRILFLAPRFQYDKARYYTMNAKLGLEIYIAGCTSKFVTVTGNALATLDLEDRGEQLAAVLEKYMVRPTQKGEALPFDAVIGQARQPVPLDLDDAVLLEKAQRGKNGADFAALWAGDVSRYGSHSEADMALINALVWWTNGDTQRVDRLFRQSGLMREKWDRPQAGSTYGAITIQNALDTRRGGYDPEAYRQESAKRDFTGVKRSILRPVSTVQPKRATYLIKPYLPKGVLAVMGGVSGSGKTWLVLSWAAAISNGQALPFMDPLEARPESGYVYYFTQENDPNVVIRPRLDLLGANMEKILIQTDSEGGYDPITMNDPRLEEAAKEYPPALVIFDPIQSYLGAGVEMNKANEVRPVLDWLGDYAKRHGCTVILISHMSKPGLGNTAALDRLLGSSDFRNAARSIIIVGRDPEDKESRVFAHDKNSMGPPGDSQRYHIDGALGVVYDGPCELSADEIVKAAAPASRVRQAVTLTDAMRQLDELLGEEGGATLEQVEALQTLAGISKSTLYNARRELDLKTVSIGQPPNRKTWWVRPDMDVEWFKVTHTEDEPAEQLTMEKKG